MSSTGSTRTDLESSYKSTLAQLARVLAFQSRLQSHGVAEYVGQPPRELTDKVSLEAAKFDEICGNVERRILRAIAVLERDARKAAGISPLLVPSSVAETAPTQPQPASSPPLPFSLPLPSASAPSAPPPPVAAPATAPMELDLTFSPSPEPQPDIAPLPLSLPTSTSNAFATGSPRVPPPPSAAAAAGAQFQSHVAPEPPALQPAPAAPSMQQDDDLNALLSTLGMPPFSAQPPPPPAAPAFQQPPPTASQQPQNPNFAPDLSLEALNALLQTSTAPPPPSTTTSAPLNFFGNVGASAPMDPATFGSFDYTSLLGTDGGGGAGMGGGLADLDFSGIGAGEFDMSTAMSQADLDALLKSVG